MEPVKRSFEEWIKYLFNQKGGEEPAWYWDDPDPIVLAPNQFIEYGTRLMRNAHEVLQPYSDEQVKDGLYRMISNLISDEIYALKDETVPLEKRLGFIQAIYDLNRTCFAKRCTSHLSHLDKETPPEVSPVNSTCYMWWDIFIIYGETDKPAVEPLNKAALDVMERCLDIPHLAVQEGALHGLGHFSMYNAQVPVRVIQAFLKRPTTSCPDLRNYATAAMTGMIE